MSKITISEAAKILGVVKKTLMRWDAQEKFPSNRDPISNIRYYDKQYIEEQAQWLKLRIKDRAHNRKLTEIRQVADKFSATTPLYGATRPIHSFQAMKSAYDALREWENVHRKIQAEYNLLPDGFVHKIDVSDFENILEEVSILELVRELLDNKQTALDINGDVIRYNCEIGNDDAWKEIDDFKKYSIDELATLINNN